MLMRNSLAIAILMGLSPQVAVSQPPPLYQGPAQATSGPGLLTNTGAFPTVPPARPLTLQKPREHERGLLPDPLGLRPPLAPAGANEQDDPRSFLPFLSPGVGPATLLTSFEGIRRTAFVPPDPILAVGPNHIMGLVNTDFAIFTKDGTKLQQIDARPWYNNIVPGTNAFDPKVIYDHFEDRWVMVWLAADGDTLNPSSHILVSVSDDADPTGTWCNFAFRGDFNGTTQVNNWSDYQGVGFDENAVYVVPNQFGFTGGWFGVKLRILPKADLYDPSCPSVTWTDFWDLRDPDNTSVTVGTTRPAVTFGAPGFEYLISDSPYGTGTFMTLWSLSDPLLPSPTLTAVNVAVTASNGGPPNANQLGGSATLIDVGGRRVRNVVYRDGSVWTAHSVPSSNGAYARARYVRIDVSGPTVLEDVSFGSDGCWLYYPAVTSDVAGNMFMVYNQSCTDTYIDIRYTGRLVGDTELRPSEELKDGEANYVVAPGGRNRWGDYNGIAVDPVDPTRVWMYAEYAASPANTWSTWFGEVIARSMGDVNDDGAVNVGDVVALVDIILERTSADPVTAAVSDCNVDQAVDIGDIVCLVDVILGSNPAMVASIAPGSPTPRAVTAALQLEPASLDGGSRTLLLEVAPGTGIAGMQAHIRYDVDRVRLGRPVLAKRAEGFQLAVEDRGGVLRLLVFDVEGGSLPSGEGPLVRLPVYIKEAGAGDDGLGIELVKVLLAGEGGFVQRAEIVEANLVALPAEYYLSNPYPNPLSRGAGTRLDLEIPELRGPALSGGGGQRADGAVKVVVDVYNVRGQRVRQLIDDFMLPGKHKLEWDGRNDRGEWVGAGLYVMRVRAGSFTATRKLVAPGG